MLTKDLAGGATSAAGDQTEGASGGGSTGKDQVSDGSIVTETGQIKETKNNPMGI